MKINMDDLDNEESEAGCSWEAHEGAMQYPSVTSATPAATYTDLDTAKVQCIAAGKEVCQAILKDNHNADGSYLLRSNSQTASGFPKWTTLVPSDSCFGKAVASAVTDAVKNHIPTVEESGNAALAQAETECPVPDHWPKCKHLTAEQVKSKCYCLSSCAYFANHNDCKKAAEKMKKAATLTWDKMMKNKDEKNDCWFGRSRAICRIK